MKMTSAAARYGQTGINSQKISRMPAAIMTSTTSARMSGLLLSSTSGASVSAAHRC